LRGRARELHREKLLRAGDDDPLPGGEPIDDEPAIAGGAVQTNLPPGEGLVSRLDVREDTAAVSEHSGAGQLDAGLRRARDREPPGQRGSGRRGRPLDQEKEAAALCRRVGVGRDTENRRIYGGGVRVHERRHAAGGRAARERDTEWQIDARHRRVTRDERLDERRQEPVLLRPTTPHRDETRLRGPEGRAVSLERTACGFEVTL